MRPDDRADRIKTLRDLWSEMMQNHTDIQRLWKNVGKGGLIWPTGIEAPPPIIPFESSSSSSSSSMGCGSCGLDLTSVTLTLSDFITEWNGTFTLTWDGTNFVYCSNVPIEAFSAQSVQYSVVCDDISYGPRIRYFSGTDCTGSFTTIINPFGWTETGLTCDPFFWEGIQGGSTATITE